MLQDELARLAQAPLDRSLAGLEADIWRGVATRLAERGAYRRALAWQLAILTLATLGSLGVGHQVASAQASAPGASALAPYTRLAAVDQLLGEPR